MNTLAFPRTNSPLVSVLLPTRGRPGWLAQSVSSLHSQADQPDKIEYLFRVDSDDQETINTCTLLVNQIPNARMLVDRRGNGYADMHLWVNTLCKLARGDWLLLWNDDALLETPRWDEILAHTQVQSWHKNPEIYMLVIPVKGRPAYCTEFMFVRRRVIELLGHYSLSPHNDNWLTRVMSKANCWSRIETLSINHCSDTINDQTRQESVAAYAEGALAKATLETPEAQKLLSQDARTLLEYLHEGL